MALNLVHSFSGLCFTCWERKDSRKNSDCPKHVKLLPQTWVSAIYSPLLVPGNFINHTPVSQWFLLQSLHQGENTVNLPARSSGFFTASQPSDILSSVLPDTSKHTQPPSHNFSWELLGCTYLAHFKPLSTSPHNHLSGAPAWTAICLTSSNAQFTATWTCLVFLSGARVLIPCCMSEAPATSALSNSFGVCISLVPGGKLNILQEPRPVFREERIRDYRQDGGKKVLGISGETKCFFVFLAPEWEEHHFLLANNIMASSLSPKQRNRTEKTC